jgi:hypothetical protein
MVIQGMGWGRNLRTSAGKSANIHRQLWVMKHSHGMSETGMYEEIEVLYEGKLPKV